MHDVVRRARRRVVVAADRARRAELLAPRRRADCEPVTVRAERRGDPVGEPLEQVVRLDGDDGDAPLAERDAVGAVRARELELERLVVLAYDGYI